MAANTIEERIDRLHANGIVDLHFDLPMDLYERRNRKNVLVDDFLPELEAGNIGVLGAAIYIADLDLLRIFYELGVRSIGLTHARRNAAGNGGVFAPSGSSRDGLTAFGRELVRECEALGVIVDLAHINPAGFDEIVDLTTKPLIV